MAGQMDESELAVRIERAFFEQESLDSDLSNGVEYHLKRPSITAELLDTLQQNTSLRQELCSYNALIEQLNDQIQQQSSEIVQLRREVVDLRTKRKNDNYIDIQLLQENAELRKENQNCHELCGQLATANRNLMQRYNEMDSTAVSFEQTCRLLREELELQKEDNTELNEINEKLIKDNTKIHAKMKDVQAKLSKKFPTWIELPEKDVDLDKMNCFFEQANRKKAEEILKNRRDGDFLIRRSEMSSSDYCISVRSVEHTRHFTIRRFGPLLLFGINSFSSWKHLLDYYSNHPIATSGSISLRLKKPLDYRREGVVV